MAKIKAAKAAEIKRIKIGDMTALSIHEVARKLGLTSLTLRKYCQARKIRGQKIGRHWFITEDAVKDFLSAQAGPSAAELLKQPRVQEGLQIIAQGKGQKPKA